MTRIGGQIGIATPIVTLFVARIADVEIGAQHPVTADCCLAIVEAGIGVGEVAIFAVFPAKPDKTVAARAGAVWASMSANRIWISAIRFGSLAVSASVRRASRSASAFRTVSSKLT